MNRSPFKNFIIVALVSIVFCYFFIAFEPRLLLPILEPAVVEGLGLSTAIRPSLPLSQYMIKGAYNATYDGKTMSIEQFKKVLTSGTRFIDLEIRSLDNMPVLMAAGAAKQVLKDTDYIYFRDVLETIVSNAFTNVPNKGDPLFINFRIILDPESNQSIFYNNMANLVHSWLNPRLYSGGITSSMPLSSLMGKIVLCIDVSLTPDYKSFTQCSPSGCVPLYRLINCETRGNTWLTVDYEHVVGLPPILNNVDDGSVVLPMNIKPLLNLVVPPATTVPYQAQKNPSPIDLYNFVDMNGMQLILFMYYQPDTANNELSYYESIFANTGAAFVPLGYAINYINQSYKKFKGAQTANYKPVMKQ